MVYNASFFSGEYTASGGHKAGAGEGGAAGTICLSERTPEGHDRTLKIYNHAESRVSIFI